MLQPQYDKIAEAVYKIVDEQLEIDTIEGNETYQRLCNELFEVFLKYKKIQSGAV